MDGTICVCNFVKKKFTVEPSDYFVKYIANGEMQSKQVKDRVNTKVPGPWHQGCDALTVSPSQCY